MSGTSREPGWYLDRNDPEFKRYWNGRAWTARRHPVNAPSPPPPLTQRAEAPHRLPAVSISAPDPAKRRLPVWLWIVGSLMVVRTLFGVVAAFDNAGTGSTSTVTHHPSAVSSPATPH